MKKWKTLAAAVLLRTQIVWENMGQTGCMEDAPLLEQAVAQLTAEDLKGLEQLEQTEYSPYVQLIRAMTPAGVRQSVAQTLLDYAICVYFYPQFGALLKQRYQHVVTLELAFWLEGIDSPEYTQLKELSEKGMLYLDHSTKEVPFFHVEFYADDWLLGFLSGHLQIDQHLNGICTLTTPQEPLCELYARRELCQELADRMAQHNLLELRGEAGSGRKFLFSHAAKARGESVLFVNLPELWRRKNAFPFLVGLIRREALVRSGWVCIDGVSPELEKQFGQKGYELVAQVIGPLQKEKIKVAICTQDGVELLSHMRGPAYSILVPPLTRVEAIAVWDGYQKQYDIPVDAVQMGSLYHVTPKEIAFLCQQMQLRKGQKESIERLLPQLLPPALTFGEIEPVYDGCTLEHLVVSDEIRNNMETICAHIRHSHLVYDQWNLKERYSYGTCVSVLLSGPPGTGKTMAARAIANQLQMPLYHVNLAQIADKYIGETAKHLEAVFRCAQRGNLILFFDEADAVFGKRSEVKDSRDRYANLEVSYLLQRMEHYDGVVLLATNYKGNIDRAFLRRIRYVLHFQLPDEQERLQLWQSCIPTQCPVGFLDLPSLAQKFELSGSEIKSAVLTAVFRAAALGESLSMSHLVYGIQNEMQKRGEVTFTEEMGLYSG